MPSEKRYLSNSERQSAYRRRCAEARRAELQTMGLPALPSIPTIPGRRRWSQSLAAVAALLTTVSNEMRSYYDARSDAWRDSDRGEDFSDRICAIREICDGVTDLLAE